MKCMYCNGRMQQGKFIYGNMYPGTFHPHDPNDNKFLRAKKLLFGSKDMISCIEVEEAWYCPNCKKVVTIMSIEDKQK